MVVTHHPQCWQRNRSQPHDVPSLVISYALTFHLSSVMPRSYFEKRTSSVIASSVHPAFTHWPRRTQGAGLQVARSRPPRVRHDGPRMCNNTQYRFSHQSFILIVNPSPPIHPPTYLLSTLLSAHLSTHPSHPVNPPLVDLAQPGRILFCKLKLYFPLLCFSLIKFYFDN